MTMLALTPATEVDIRWREWQARGAAKDRRNVIVMSTLATVIAFGLAVFFFATII
jgi:hypothetical protein